MVRATAVLARIPVIKFRKGGLGQSAGTPAAAAAAAPASAAAQPQPQQIQPAAAMSTGAIPDIDLPPRYQRQPLTDEEIDHINGGGIKDSSHKPDSKTDPRALAVIRIPRGVLVETGQKRKQVMSLNIVIQKPQ